SEEAALAVGTVGGADDDVVSFVALDALEVADEEAFEAVATAPLSRFVESSREVRVAARGLVERLDDEVTLRQVEADDADGRGLVVVEQPAHDGHDLVGLALIGALLVGAVHLHESQWSLGRAVVGVARDGLEARLVEALVR